MKLDFSKPIRDLKNEPIVENGAAVTLGSVACKVLEMLMPDEQNLPSDKKVKRFELALIAAQGNEQEVTPQQFTEIHELIGKAYPPLVVGRAYEIMDEAAKS